MRYNEKQTKILIFDRLVQMNEAFFVVRPAGHTYLEVKDLY